MATRFYKTGFATTDTPGDILCLRANPTAAGNYDCLEASGSNHAPSGKTLYITKVMYSGSGAGASWKLVYGNNAKDHTSVAPTSAVVMTDVFKVASTNTVYEISLFVAIPDGKYPHILCATDAIQATFLGIEI